MSLSAVLACNPRVFVMMDALSCLMSSATAMSRLDLADCHQGFLLEPRRAGQSAGYAESIKTKLSACCVSVAGWPDSGFLLESRRASLDEEPGIKTNTAGNA